MSDPLYADLIIQQKDLALFQEHIDLDVKFYEKGKYFCSDEEINLVSFCSSSINGGKLGWEDRLRELGIPYNKWRSNSDSIYAATECFRINAAGEVVMKEIFDEADERISLRDVENAHENGTIEELIKKTKEDIRFPSWFPEASG
ncbi:hypothetical protein ACQU0X_27370 [Pseudovibrio ascidiaceicola]|uniref:hypothetical protein n=1 Tax=Pseudovibrio ascidiaceicola TaxID=285279 RepID=UPI003D368A70